MENLACGFLFEFSKYTMSTPLNLRIKSVLRLDFASNTVEEN